MKSKSVLSLFLASIFTINSYAADKIDPAEKFTFPDHWKYPTAPFQIADHTWYIGTEGLTSVLIKTDEGAILIDTGLPGAEDMLIANMKKLGVAPADLKWILHSHAHEDHVGSHAAVRLITHAPIATNAESAALLMRGGKDDIHFGDKAAFPATQTDQYLMDGETIKLGHIQLTAHFTPAHTPGSMSWTWTDQRNGKPIRIAYADSLSAPGYRLINNPRYPHIVDDFKRGIAAVRALPCDMLLTPHPEASGWNPADADKPHQQPITCAKYADKKQKELAMQVQKERKRK